jgi:hypothetical protein
LALSAAQKFQMFVALIRTHHITSRKKVATLKAAAKKLGCYALLRSGGVPGVMYVQASEREVVQKWVDTVHDLRYKDYQLAAPVMDAKTATESARGLGETGILEEVANVKDMRARMDSAGLSDWWRKAMGFSRA